ncbi:MAG: hypothetical protein AAF402_08460 [Pseudomonadota bacterium]
MNNSGSLNLHPPALVLLGLYSALALVSHHVSEPIHFLTAASLAAGLLVFWTGIVRNGARLLSFRSMLAYAVIYRIIAVTSAPLLEDDYYRFLLDGCVFWAQGSPYGISPQSILDMTGSIEACRDLSLFVNYPEVETIYPPVLQGIFAFAWMVSGDSLVGLKIIFAVLDVLIILLMTRFCRPSGVLLYAWCPLVIKETVINAHPDVVGIVFLLAAFTALTSGRFRTSVVFLATACASKVFAWILAPLLLLYIPKRAWPIFPVVLCIIYLPFLISGAADFSTLGLFAQHWQFNHSLFGLLDTVLADQPARVISLLLFATVWGAMMIASLRYVSRNDIHWVPVFATIVYMAFFLLSPVVNAWYLIWMLPFAAATGLVSPWVWSIAIVLSYYTGIGLPASLLEAYQIHPWAYALQYCALAVAIWFDLRSVSNKKKLNLQIP